MIKKEEGFEPIKTVTHKVTQEDIDSSRFLGEEGIKVGDEIEVLAPEEITIPEEVPTPNEAAASEEVPTPENVSEHNQAVIQENSLGFFSGPEGAKLPTEAEGHTVTSCIGSKENNGKTLYVVICDDGCTYDVEAL